MQLTKFLGTKQQWNSIVELYAELQDKHGFQHARYSTYFDYIKQLVNETNKYNWRAYLLTYSGNIHGFVTMYEENQCLYCTALYIKKHTKQKKAAIKLLIDKLIEEAKPNKFIVITIPSEYESILKDYGFKPDCITYYMSLK